MSDTATMSRKFQISIPKGKGVLLMPVPTLADITGIAAGANTEGYRDREDRW